MSLLVVLVAVRGGCCGGGGALLLVGMCGVLSLRFCEAVVATDNFGRHASATGGVGGEGGG